MKKRSVLIQRAWAFTAIVLTVAVAALLCAGLLVNVALSRSQARNAALRQARLLAQAVEAEDEAYQQGGAEAILEAGGGVYRIDTLQRSPIAFVRWSNFDLPEAEVERAVQLDGGEVFTDFVQNLRLYACAMTTANTQEGAVTVAVALPVGSGHPLLCAAIALAVSAAVAALLWQPVTRWKLNSVVHPLEELRDVASSVADGNLDLRANEKAPGEIGELGASLNHVSTQLSRNMYQLILERNRLKHMLDGLSEGIVAIDRTGEITHTNPALEKLFTRQKPLIHLPDPRMKVIPEQSVWTDLDSVMASGEKLTRSLDVRDVNLRLTITPIKDELGSIVGAVGLISDVTQMERLERTRREYVSNISHELRTPLTAMRALVEPLKEGMVTQEEDRQRYYDIILREVLRLSRLINDQLELSRLQSGTLAIEKSRVALDDLIYDVCERYRSIASEAGLTLLVPDNLSDCPQVWTNADRVEQLLIILLDNAIKYTEQGSVSILASWNEERVVLTVKDTGIGIEEADLPYVFDRFYKVDKAHSGKGSGLGLSIASELLRRMGEEIWVTSELGKGTEFNFTLHRQPPEE
ncbi:MAG: HAMP domain-containing protein [Clostridia bacterium]|nr:HAMP domain-containing protein [Clostridia bacterium]